MFIKKFAVTAVAVGLLSAVVLVGCGSDGDDDPPPVTQTGCQQWGSWTVTTPATCDAAGVETKSCTQQGTTTAADSTRAIPMLTGAQCESGGCASWGDWTLTTAATCNAPGLETRWCAVSPYQSETRDIPQLTCDIVNGGDLVYEGRIYPTVIIKGRRWMAESMRQPTENSWCYNDNPAMCDVYGRLYTWNDAVSVCAAIGDGWGLPSQANWQDLGSDIEAGQDFGLSLLFGGVRLLDGSFTDFDNSANFWSATQRTSQLASLVTLWKTYGGFMIAGNDKPIGASVRCVQD